MRLTSLGVVRHLRAGAVFRIWWIHPGDSDQVAPNYVLEKDGEELCEVQEVLVHSMVKRGLLYSVVHKKASTAGEPDQVRMELTEKGEAWKAKP